MTLTMRILMIMIISSLISAISASSCEIKSKLFPPGLLEKYYQAKSTREFHNFVNCPYAAPKDADTVDYGSKIAIVIDNIPRIKQIGKFDVTVDKDFAMFLADHCRLPIIADEELIKPVGGDFVMIGYDHEYDGMYQNCDHKRNYIETRIPIRFTISNKHDKVTKRINGGSNSLKPSN
jgi:hypothetical protein